MMISPFVIAAHRSNNDFIYAGRPQACRIATRAATTVSKLWMRGSTLCTCMNTSATEANTEKLVMSEVFIVRLCRA